jgi:hypothetical protein
MGVLLIKNLRRHYANAGVLKQVFRAMKISLGKFQIRRRTGLFFETGGKNFPPNRGQMSGNPV